jgi:hypothetical protein
LNAGTALATFYARSDVTRARRWKMRLLEAFETFLRYLEHERRCAPGGPGVTEAPDA